MPFSTKIRLPGKKERSSHPVDACRLNGAVVENTARLTRRDSNQLR